MRNIGKGNEKEVKSFEEGGEKGMIKEYRDWRKRVKRDRGKGKEAL